ncbi:MAG: phosphotransferase [Armatimonadota bacterium]|nr:MAG: phosphotransferase [Armatimonadota bacterium]
MLAATVSLLAVALISGRSLPAAGVWMLPLAWGYALIGILDDLKKAGGRGLGDRSKFLLQSVVALAFALLLWRVAGRSDVWVPFVAAPVDFGLLYLPFAALVVLATANAVNLSDGIDGLAGGATAIALLGVVGLSAGDTANSAAAACWPLIGAILGFLVYNLPPARLLMGDTGALGLGAALAALAIFARAEFVLVILGAPFVINAASVVVQMGTVRGLWRVVKRLRHGTTETARPFLCTPLHHHFQWLGWTDWRILALYWGLGAVMAAWSIAAERSGLLWLVGLIIMAAFLLAAAGQKLLRANYFLGLLRSSEHSSRLALYRGLPLVVLAWPLYRVHYETSITEPMLVGATAESILWRPITEIEAHVVLGKIYADQRLLDEALTEWEQVPVRNLLIRPSAVLRLARIYYGRDRLLEAIKLWEQLPESRLAEMPNLREVVRSAKLRLADLAGKSHRQGIRMLRNAERTGQAPERLETYLTAARRFNQDLLSLLLYERDKLKGRPADPQAARARRELLLRTRNVVLQRMRELDEALAHLARTSPPPPEKGETAAGDPARRAAQELHVSRDRLIELIVPAGEGEPQVERAAVHPKASRNTVYRLSLVWPNGGPTSIIAKRYAADRIEFFSACYRRERGVLELLGRYGCAVPEIHSGELRDDQALLIMQDLGDETLAERLEGSDPAIKRHWLRSAVGALVALHGTAHSHLRELAAEIRKIDKESLGPEYYLSALRIALGRIAELASTTIDNSDWRRIAEQAGPLIDFLCKQPGAFVHFEFTPHHLLVTEGGPHIFDFEQATIGPVEFDLAALLAQPESDVGADGWEEMVRHYAVLASESGLPVAEIPQLSRGVAYAALFKCLVYTGAAANFLHKFGGEHHLQRLHYYLDQCQAILRQWRPLRPLGLLLAPRFRAARGVASHHGLHERPAPSG